MSMVTPQIICTGNVRDYTAAQLLTMRLLASLFRSGRLYVFEEPEGGE